MMTCDVCGNSCLKNLAQFEGPVPPPVLCMADCPGSDLRRLLDYADSDYSLLAWHAFQLLKAVDADVASAFERMHERRWRTLLIEGHDANYVMENLSVDLHIKALQPQCFACGETEREKLSNFERIDSYWIRYAYWHGDDSHVILCRKACRAGPDVEARLKKLVNRYFFQPDDCEKVENSSSPANMLPESSCQAFSLLKALNPDLADRMNRNRMQDNCDAIPEFAGEFTDYLPRNDKPMEFQILKYEPYSTGCILCEAKEDLESFEGLNEPTMLCKEPCNTLEPKRLSGIVSFIMSLGEISSPLARRLLSRYSALVPDDDTAVEDFACLFAVMA